MIIHNAVQGAVDAITDIVVHDLVAAAVLAHTSPIDVQQQTGRSLSKVPAPAKGALSARYELMN